MKTTKASPHTSHQSHTPYPRELTPGTQPKPLTPEHQPDCGLCGISADQIAAKIRHAERILSRRRDRAKAARALIVIRHGVAMFDEIGGGQ